MLPDYPLVVPGYEILETLYRGNYSAVYKARGPGGVLVVVWVIGSQRLEVFARLLALQQSGSHPQAGVSGHLETGLYFATKYVEGMDVGRTIRTYLELAGTSGAATADLLDDLSLLQSDPSPSESDDAPP